MAEVMAAIQLNRLTPDSVKRVVAHRRAVRPRFQSWPQRVAADLFHAPEVTIETTPDEPRPMELVEDPGNADQRIQLRRYPRA